MGSLWILVIMKLHLPVSLFKCLLSLMPMVAAITCMPVSAEVMHRDITLLTYTDFGQNSGRYVTDASANSLLQYIRQQEGGVVITYTGGQTDYALEHGMIDFGSAYHVATAAAISPAAIATAAHHDINFTSTFTNKVYGIGNENAIKYKAIEYVKSSAFAHQEKDGGGELTDHKVVRLSKVITDVSPASIYNAASDGLNNLTYYHVGSGQQWIAPYTNNLGTMNSSSEQLIRGYNYVTGGITTTNWVYQDGGSDHKVLISGVSFMPDGITSSNPLTWVSKPGDSGSPLYVWDESKQCYSYVGSNFGELTAGAIGSVFVIDPTFDQQTVDSFTKEVNMASTVYLNAVNTQTGTMSDGTRTGEVWSGTVTDGTNTLVSYNGLKNGLNTWGDLNGVKDNQNWYTYNESYVIQNTETLFPTENLQFNAQSAQNTIILNDSVDLGIGYAEFNAGSYTISSASGEANLFNHAGYVVNAGAEVHVQLTNPADYLREWRKIGAGNLYIEGSGNNHILLNVGGSGKTYLNRTGGYAAYNVLVNNGATIVISDVNQIKRDLTFGNRGGTLEMNGKSMDWYTSAETADSNRTGFSINALTEDANISNTTAGTTSVLTYKEGGETTFKGSFVDSANSSLKIVHDANGTWELNSVRTNLQHADSGLQVNRGTVVLSGTNTVHGTGSDTGRNENRYFNEDDWHYADATMNVAVKNGGTFELGSHARLTGNVSVEQGGTYVMREGVRHQKEYVEGGQRLEDTGKYSDYFGHKGNVQLNGGTFAVQFNDGVDANTCYAGNVTGTGAMTVDTGASCGTLTFSGAVDSGISKTLNRGQLILTGTAAADTANKWLVNAGGVMVQFENAQNTLSVIDAASTGTLELTRNCTTQLDLSSHAGLHLGAQTGKTVQYGAAGTTERLTTLNFGGGGKLVVNYALSGNDSLNVHAGSMTGGEIQLANVAQNYNGTVNVQNSTLTTAADGALNGATVNLNDGGTWQLADNQHSVGGTVNVNTGGTLQGKDVVLTGTANLAGSLDYESFTVQNGGKLVMQNGGTFDDDKAVTIGNGGTLDLNGTSFTQKAELTNGGAVNGQGATIAEGAEIIATQGTGILSAGSGNFTVNGHIGAEAGATLRLEGSSADIYTGSINTGGGTLELACSTVNLGYLVNGGTQTIGGILSIAGNVTLNANQTDPYKYQTITHNINHLDVTTGSKLTLVDPSNSWNHIYNISALTGAGEIHWKSNIHWFHAGTSRMILSGDNSFRGTLIVEQVNNDGSMQQVSLAHDDAAKNMVINLWGDSDSRPGLAISTENAHVAGIGGTINTFVYAGAVKTAGNGNNPVSSALNTLTINTAGKDHTYNGTILGDAANGLNIVKDGTGKQTFTNSANVVHDVTALQGSLEFTTAPVVYGDVSIAQGAELTLGSGAFSLETGHTLNVLAGSNGGTAVLNNSLVLNGGKLCFAAYGADASLQTAGVSMGAGISSVAISFDGVSAIEEGIRYQLSSGDWSSVVGKLSITDISYLDAFVNADTSGLYASFALKDNYVYWQGNSAVLNDSAKVVFTGQNGVDAVEISNNTRVHTGIFNHDTDFSITSSNGSTMSFTTMEKSGNGVLHIDTQVETGSLSVLQDAGFAGDGQLTVSTINIAEGAQASFQDVALAVQNAITGNGKLRMEKGSSLELEGSVTGKVQFTDGSTLISDSYEPDGLFPVIPDIGIGITFGEENTASRVTLRAKGAAVFIGEVNVLGDATLAVECIEGSVSQQFYSFMNSLASLELQKNVSMSFTSALTTHLVLNGGSATAKGGQILKDDITITNGGVFTFLGDTGVCDTLDYSAENKNIVVSGGILAFGNTRQTMGTWILTLSDGAQVTGSGGSYEGKTASLDFSSNNSTIYATSGSSTISAITRLRGGNNLNYDVSEGATLTVSGKIHADDAAGKGSITKNGAGTLILSSANTYANSTTINAGVLQAGVAEALGTSSIVINGGTLRLTGNVTKVVKNNVTVNAGGRMEFVGSGSDIIDYGVSKSITLAGGVMDLGSTRQSMGGWTITMSDNAQIVQGNQSGNGVLDYYQTGSTINVTGGTGNTISAVTRLRGTDGKNINLNYDVSEGAMLTVSGLIHADNQSGKGSITKAGDGTLVLTGANTYAGTTTVNAGVLRASVNGALGNSAVVINGGVLELSPTGGEGVNASILRGEVTVNAGGTLLLGGNDNKVVDTNVTINSGGRMEFSGSGSDMLDYDSSKRITVNGGMLDFGTTRQTMGNTTLYLSNGASVMGDGGGYSDNGNHCAAMDFNNSGDTIYATEGSSSISAVTRLRGGNTLNYDVSEGATLTVSGLIHADNKAGQGAIVKNGAGTLVLTAANTYGGSTTVNDGTLQVSGAAALGSTPAVVLGEQGTLRLDMEQTASVVNLDYVTGSGNLILALSKENYGQTLTVGQGFKGTTYVEGGHFTINGSTFGNTLKLANGVNFQLTGGSTVTIDENLVLEGTSQVHQNSYNGKGATLTINGTVSGSGTYERRGGGVLNLNNTVTLGGGFVQTVPDQAVTNINATASFGSVNVTKGILNINEGATLNINNALTDTGSAAIKSTSVTGIAGSGTLGVKFGTGYGRTINVGTAFTGITHVQEGNFTLNGSVFGNALRMNGNSHIQVQGVASYVMDKNLVLDGTTQVHQNSYNGIGATLTINGTVSGAGTYDRRGGGILTINGEVNLGGIMHTISGSTTELMNDTTVGHVELTNGTIEVHKWASIATLKASQAGALTVRSDGQLVLGSVGTGPQIQISKTDAELKSTSTSASNYAANSTNFEIRNAIVKVQGEGAIEFANKLTNSSVENAGSGKLTVSNAANMLSGVVASGGDMSLLNLADSVSLNLLELAAGKSVGVYAGASESASKSAVTVSSSAIFGAGASLATAGLTLGDGVTLEMSTTGNGVNLNGAALTFGNSLKLGEQLLAEVLALRGGESVELFAGVGEFNTLGGGSHASSVSGAVQASEYFTNLAGKDGLYITYEKIGETGSLMVVNMVPEPTTATLSLLALAGLAARRRRRQ